MYAHSVHVKRCALCAYTDRTEAGSALAADGLSAEFLGPASTSSSISCSACSRPSPSSSSFKRRRLPLRRSTRGGDGGRRLAACHVAPWSTSMGTAAVVAGASATPAGSMLPALPGVRSSTWGQGPATTSGSPPRGGGAAYPARSGCMCACPPSWPSKTCKSGPYTIAAVDTASGWASCMLTRGAAATAVYPARAGSSVAACPSWSSSLESMAASSSNEEEYSPSEPSPSLLLSSSGSLEPCTASSARAVAAASADPLGSMPPALPGGKTNVLGLGGRAGAGEAGGGAQEAVAHVLGPGHDVCVPGELLL